MVRTAALSFAAGFIDTCGFIALSGLFAAQITGNFVLLGATLTGDAVGAASKILALPVFALTVSFVTVLVRRAERESRPILGRIYLMQVALLFLFFLIGWVEAPFDNPDSFMAILTGIVAVAAMSIQNATAMLGEPAPIFTTAMTHNATRAIIDAVDLLRQPEAVPEAERRFGALVLGIASFAVGALMGATGFLLADYACLLVPITALLLIQLFAPPSSGMAEERSARLAPGNLPSNRPEAS
jgi:uncharacterized membrane protein YoaK (UPF0700 family)